MTMRSLRLFATLTSAPIAIGLSASPYVLAQVSDAQQRAVNMARMRAEKINGGLSRYRAASCMYNTSRGGGDCLINSDGGFTFMIPGGEPGWQEAGKPPSVETEIKISPDGREVMSEIYNGSPR